MRARQPNKQKHDNNKPLSTDNKLSNENISSTKKILIVGFILLIVIAAIFGVLSFIYRPNRNEQQKADIKINPTLKPKGKPHSSTYQIIKSNPKATVNLFGENHLYQNETAIALNELIIDENAEIFILSEFAPRNKKVLCGKLLDKHKDITCIGMEDPQYVLESHQSRITTSTSQAYQMIFHQYNDTNNATLTDKLLKQFATYHLQQSREIAQKLGFPSVTMLLTTPAENFAETIPVHYYAAYLASKQIMSDRAKNISYEDIFTLNEDKLMFSEPDPVQDFVKRNNVYADTIIDIHKKPLKNNKPRTILAYAGVFHMVDAGMRETECAKVLHKRLDDAHIEFQVVANNEAMKELNRPN